jgi:hypothetical protein
MCASRRSDCATNLVYSLKYPHSRAHVYPSTESSCSTQMPHAGVGFVHGFALLVPGWALVNTRRPKRLEVVFRTTGPDPRRDASWAYTKSRKRVQNHIPNMPPPLPCLAEASPCIFSDTFMLTSKNLATHRSRQTLSPLLRSASR